MGYSLLNPWAFIKNPWDNRVYTSWQEDTTTSDLNSRVREYPTLRTLHKDDIKETIKKPYQNQPLYIINK